MEVRDYLKILRRRWVSILVIALLGAGLAAGLTALQTPQYASNARLFVTTSDADDSTLLQGGQFSAQRVKSYADLVSSRELANRVKADLGLDVDADVLAGKVSAEVVVDTVNLELTVTDPDASEAQRIAQSYAEQLTDLVRELETPPGQAQAPIKATIVDAASFSESPVSPKPERNIALGLVLGALIGFGLAVLRSAVDTRITSTEDLTATVDEPILGAIGFDPDAKGTPLVSSISSHAPRAEAFRVLRTNLQFVDVDKQHKMYVVSSAMPSEGKTSTSLNLAISLAQAGVRTLLVEADLRRPRAGVRLGIDDAIGVTNVLVGSVSWSDAVLTHEETGLDFLAAGPVPPNPAELLQSNAMHDLLDELRQKYDVVLIDAPPLLPVTDAALLAAAADGAILVVRHGKSTRDQVAHAVERLEAVDAELTGLVLNMVPAKSTGHGYGYGYGYAPDVAGTTRT